MDKLIQLSAVVRYPLDLTFRLFTQNGHLKNWLTQAADVEPAGGGNQPVEICCE